MVASIQAPRISMSVDDRKARTALARLQADVNRTLTKISDIAKKVGIGVGIGLAYAVKQFADFEASNARVQNIMQASNAEMKLMEKGLLDLSKRSPKTATELSKAWQKVAEAGVRGADSLHVLEAATNASVAAQSNLVETTDQLTDIMVAFGINMKEAARVSDVLVVGSQMANTTIEQLGEALRRVGGRAEMAGLSVEQTTAALLAMASVDKGQRAGRGLNSLLSQLAKNNDRISASNPSLSIYDQSGAMRSLVSITKSYEKALAGKVGRQKDDIIALVGEQLAQRALTALVNAGSESLIRYEEAMRNSSGAAQQASDKYLATLKGSFLVAKSAVDAFAITLGGKLAPHLIKVAEWITNLANKLDNLSDKTIDNILKWAGLTAKFMAATWVAIRLVKAFRAVRLIVLGVSAVMRGALIPTMKAVRLNASLMWGAMTLGLSFLITFLPEIYGWFKKLLGVQKEITKTAPDFSDPNHPSKSGKLHANEFGGVEGQKDKASASIDEPAGGTQGVAQRTEARAAAAADLQARLDGTKDFYDKRLQLQQDFTAAQDILNGDERAKAMETLRERQEELAAAEDEFRAQREEVRAEAEALLREHELEFSEKNLELLTDELMTKAEIEEKFEQDRIKDLAADLNKKLELEKKHGKALGSFIHATNSDRFKGTQKLFGDLAGLAKEFGKEGFIAFKIFSIAEGVMNTIKAVSNALAAPYPPPIPQILAGVAGAMGAVQVAKMAAQQTPSFAQGGFVPGIPPAAGVDNMTIRAASGELMLPSNTAEGVLKREHDAGFAEGQASGGGGAPIVIHNIIEVDGLAIARATAQATSQDQS